MRARRGRSSCGAGMSEDDDSEEEDVAVAMALSQQRQTPPSTLNIRVRAPGGQWTLAVLSDMPVSKLKLLIQEKSAIPAQRQKLLTGYPPTALTAADALTLESAGVKNNATFVVQELAQQAAQTAQTAPPASKAGPKSTGEAAAATKPAGETRIIKRDIKDDNSCLFNAIGYVLDNRNRQAASLLRQVVASIVVSQKERFGEGILEGGRSPAAYAEYILDADKWGGSVELQILSEYYEAEIAAADIVSKNIYIYGQGKGYKKRVYLAYSGIHYDALVMNEHDASDESKDVTIFASNNSQVEAAVRKFITQKHENKMFTNVQRFSLRCDECGQGLTGSVKAAEHAKATGHKSFSDEAGRIRVTVSVDLCRKVGNGEDSGSSTENYGDINTKRQLCRSSLFQVGGQSRREIDININAIKAARKLRGDPGGSDGERGPVRCYFVAGDPVAAWELDDDDAANAAGGVSSIYR
eukprot:g77087.t1